MREVALYGGLLAVSLVGAYLSWTAPEETVTEGEVAMYRADAPDLQSIAWDSEKVDVKLERRSDKFGEYVWVTLSEEKLVKPAIQSPEPEEDPAEGEQSEEGEEAPMGPEATPAEPEPEPVYETRTTQFLGNAAADGLWDQFAPLTAVRELGDANDAMGFGEPTATITVGRKAGPVELVVGGETYGAKDRYVERDGKAYLIKDAALRPLQFASTRLIERRLFPLGETDLESVHIKAPAGDASFLQKNKDDRAKAFWARADSPDAEDAAVGTWLGKIFRLKVATYVSEAERPALTEPVLLVEFQGKGEAWPVSIHNVDGTWYAQSAFNRGVVEITASVAAEAAADLESLLAE